MYINSNLLEASLETRTKADIANASKIPPSIGRVLYDANGNVIRVGDGTKFKNSSDLELRTTAELATDAKYLGATRYDSDINALVVWNGVGWISADTRDMEIRNDSQLALEAPVLGRHYYSNSRNTIVIGNGASWIYLAQANQLVPVGTVTAFAGATIPSGHLFCGGESYPIALFPDLFAVIQYTYGGSGAFFEVPNLRATFIRGLGGANNAALGVIQTSQNKSHDHFDGLHYHYVASSIVGGADVALAENNYPTKGGAYPTTASNYTLGGAATTPTIGRTSQNSSSLTSQQGGSEARPYNMAMNYIIKY